MRIVIEKRKNHEHNAMNEEKEIFEEFEQHLARKELQAVADEYEANINAQGFEMEDQDDMNNVQAILNLVPDEYDFNCGYFTYFVTIEE